MGGAAGATAMLMFPPGRRKKACLSIVNVLAISRDAQTKCAAEGVPPSF